LDLPVVLLGVLKAGGVYLPLDPGLPVGRLELMLGVGGVSVVVCAGGWPVVGFGGVVVDVVGDAGWVGGFSGVDPGWRVGLDELAYVVFTSGSTGVPKGVGVPHRQVLNRLVWMWGVFPFGVGEVGCVKTSVGFVDSLWELLGPLLCGVRSVVVSDVVVRDPFGFVGVLAGAGVTRLLLVPSLLRGLLDVFGGGLGGRLPGLRFWVCSGEALPWSLWERFVECVPGARLYNLYGTSEVWDATWYDPEPVAGSGVSVPVGRPVAGVRVYVLDAGGEPVPVGVSGGLWVGGVGLAQGYLGDPVLTADRFRPDPFGEPGSRMYDTGDVAFFLPGGDVQFVGRADHQVKVRGVRVEPAEIEAVLNEHPDVRASVVVAGVDATGEARLVGYVVPRSAEPPNTSALRAHLRERLAEAMLPSAFVPIDELPRNAHGKVDRRALPDPTGVRPRLDGDFVPARSAVERRLTEIWTAVLGIDQVGVHDNFFDLGGTSLSLVKAHELIVAEFGVDLTVVRLFQHPTIHALAAYLEQDGQDVADRVRRGREVASRRRERFAQSRARRGNADPR
jgi:amino acid adenylation domain-containing protein